MFDFFPPSLHSLILPSPPPPTPADSSPVRGGIHSRSCCLSFSTGLSAVASIHLPPPCLLLSYSHSWRYDSAFFSFFSPPLRAVFAAVNCEIHFFMSSAAQSWSRAFPFNPQLIYSAITPEWLMFDALWMWCLHICLSVQINAASPYRIHEVYRSASPFKWTFEECALTKMPHC